MVRHHQPLERAPLRDRIYDILRESIVQGELAPGATVRDTEIASTLGASRTPVREALVRLTSEHLLANEVGRGFRVPPLERAEVEEAHPLMCAFEPLALRGAAPCSTKQAKRLEALVRKMERPKASARERHGLDANWHRTLIAGSPNARLLRYVEELRDTLRRYELAYLAGVEGMELSAQEHRAIAAAYVDGERERAVQLLTEHWERGRDELLLQLPDETETSGANS